MPDRKIKIFLSSGSKQMETLARPWIYRLLSHGGFDVYDWTRDPNWTLGRPPTEAELATSAARCENAVRSCDLFWYVVPNEKSEGAASELTLARYLGKTIIASGEFGARNIFALLIPPSMRFATHEEAFVTICDIETKGRTFVGEF